MRTFQNWAFIVALVTFVGLLVGPAAAFAIFGLCMIGLFLGAAGRSYKATNR